MDKPDQQDECRQQFEKWAESRKHLLDKQEGFPHVYKAQATMWAWAAWQAAWDTRAALPEKPMTDWKEWFASKPDGEHRYQAFRARMMEENAKILSNRTLLERIKERSWTNFDSRVICCFNDVEELINDHMEDAAHRKTADIDKAKSDSMAAVFHGPDSASVEQASSTKINVAFKEWIASDPYPVTFLGCWRTSRKQVGEAIVREIEEFWQESDDSNFDRGFELARISAIAIVKRLTGME
jgi:hypothetical protein